MCLHSHEASAPGAAALKQRRAAQPLTQSFRNSAVSTAGAIVGHWLQVLAYVTKGVSLRRYSAVVCMPGLL